MSTFLSVIAFILFAAFIIGLIKPSLVRMSGRKQVSAVYLGGFLALCVINAILNPAEPGQAVAKKQAQPQKAEASPPPFKYADKTLTEYRKERTDTRHKIVAAYMAYRQIPETAAQPFYACVSQSSYTNQGETPLGVVADWCFTEYRTSPEMLAKRINFDTFQANFSGWNGAYRPLEALIKAGMHDDSSYKHLSTRYRLILTDDPHATIETTFRGTNAFGGVVKETVSARVDLRTGDVVSFNEM
ncbi:TPA: hypothetical protein ACHTOV_003633 [Enterobacter cancerogenus]|uniref:hypothetical protein n=1 Tax=Enterobacter cancerogenus TaxID=69218 RepID=UPI00129A0460|nr:hypothetical protein [Enterobacter cancerogenus]MRG34184.1 hypothetical protein [Enterobacter cancerogenus]QZY39596.1 hypothetical protein HU826_24125 [Enterobacter cancerogenus]